MNTKKAINTLEFYKIDPPKHCERNEELQEIIELLQRGEKFEFISSDMDIAIQHMLDKTYFYNIKTDGMTDAEYIDKAFHIIEDKYFPKLTKKIITIEIKGKDREEVEAKLRAFQKDVSFLNREYQDNNVQYKIEECD